MKAGLRVAGGLKANSHQWGAGKRKVRLRGGLGPPHGAGMVLNPSQRLTLKDTLKYGLLTKREPAAGSLGCRQWGEVECKQSYSGDSDKAAPQRGMAATSLSLTLALPGGPWASSAAGCSPGTVMELCEPQDTALRVTHPVLPDSLVPRWVSHGSPTPGGSWGLWEHEGEKAGNGPGDVWGGKGRNRAQPRVREGKKQRERELGVQEGKKGKRTGGTRGEKRWETGARGAGEEKKAEIGLTGDVWGEKWLEMGTRIAWGEKRRETGLEVCEGEKRWEGPLVPSECTAVPYQVCREPPLQPRQQLLGKSIRLLPLLWGSGAL